MLSDPMGLLLASARVDPMLMAACRQVDEELQSLRARVSLLEELVRDAREFLHPVTHNRYQARIDDAMAS